MNENRNKRSFNVALCGIIASLAIVSMFMSGIIPVLMYTMPAISGTLISVIVIEVNKKWAWSTYAAVGILSLFVTPVKDASLLFILFLGYYPILKSTLEKIKSKILSWGAKIAIFNAAVIIFYQILIRFISSSEMLEEVNAFGKYGAWILLGFANIVFVVYDIALTRLISSYYNWFRKKFLRIKK
ncbi:MAG: hypothetical protein GX896_10240 [Clostridiales bacterium]|nr:hypothetical protein [Clostridiales bacterium]